MATKLRSIFTLNRLLLISALLSVVLAVLAGYHLQRIRAEYLHATAGFGNSRSSLTGNSYPRLIGELDISQVIADGSLYDYPDAFIEEMNNIWGANHLDFITEVNTSSLVVQSIMPSGEFADAYQLPLQRATAYIESHLPLDALFLYMTTPEKGFALIDPLKAMQEAKRVKQRKHQQQQQQQQQQRHSPVLSYSWGRGRLELDYELFQFMWPLSAREFTVLNVVDAQQRIFVSKSVRFPADLYYNHIKKMRADSDSSSSSSGSEVASHLLEGANQSSGGTKKDIVRAINNFALKITELPAAAASAESTAAATTATTTVGGSRSSSFSSGSNSQQSVLNLHRYKFEMINFAAGIVPYTPLAHYVNSKLYFPLVVQRMRSVLRTVAALDIY